VRPLHHRYGQRLNKLSFSVNDLMQVYPPGFVLLADIQNPLSFSLQSDVEGDVGEAVEHVSNDIVASSESSKIMPVIVADLGGSRYMPAIYELRSQLSDRANRLRYLISFIRESGLMSKVSLRVQNFAELIVQITQSSRRRIQRNAEKVQAAMELWDHQNRLMEYAPPSLLVIRLTG
jgi:nuclear pore complex protein Nup133